MASILMPGMHLGAARYLFSDGSSDGTGCAGLTIYLSAWIATATTAGSIRHVGVSVIYTNLTLYIDGRFAGPEADRRSSR